MRYLLDTNIISNVTKPTPSAALLAWMSEQNDDDLYIASLTVAELRRGVLEGDAISSRPGLAGRKDHRRFSRAAYFPLTKRPGWSALDIVIAAVAEANGCVVVTAAPLGCFSTLGGLAADAVAMGAGRSSIEILRLIPGASERQSP
jgi:predicted nucleic acid-binding protein